MQPLRFLTDEDVYGAIAIELRRNGYDAVSTPETGRLRESDDSQLVWATSTGRAFFTFNVAHFAKLHTDLLRSGNTHCGIIVSQWGKFCDDCCDWQICWTLIRC